MKWNIYSSTSINTNSLINHENNGSWTSIHNNNKKFFHNRLAVAISVLKQHENNVIYIRRVGYNTCVVTVRQFYTGYATIAIELKQQSKLTGLVRFHGYWVLRRERGGGGGSFK